jgi:hypothetical protein
MHPILSAIGSVASLRFRSRASLELEIIALRHQLGVLRRRQPTKIRVPLADRIFWMWLYRICPRALDVMVLVKPYTVIRSLCRISNVLGLAFRQAEVAESRS